MTTKFKDIGILDREYNYAIEDAANTCEHAIQSINAMGIEDDEHGVWKGRKAQCKYLAECIRALKK